MLALANYELIFYLTGDLPFISKFLGNFAIIVHGKDEILWNRYHTYYSQACSVLCGKCEATDMIELLP